MHKLGSIEKGDIVTLNDARQQVLYLSRELGFSRIKSARIASVFSDLVMTSEKDVILTDTEIFLDKKDEEDCLLFNFRSCNPDMAREVAEKFFCGYKHENQKSTHSLSGWFMLPYLEKRPDRAFVQKWQETFSRPSRESLLTKLQTNNRELEEQAGQLKQAKDEAVCNSHELEERLDDLAQARRAMLNIMEDLEISKAGMSALIEALPDVISIYTSDGVFRDFFLGQEASKEEFDVPELKDTSLLIGRNIRDVLSSETAERIQNAIDGALSSDGVASVEYSMNMGGKVRWFDGHFTAMKKTEDINGSDLVVSVSRDISKLKELTRDLALAKEDAEAATKAKGDFLANMSHEIRTPMNGILGFSELLRSPELSQEERSNFTDVIIRSGNQLLRIINDVLEVSRLETGQVEVMNTRVNLNGMMTDLWRFFCIQAEKMEVLLEKQVPEEEVVGHLDGGKLTQVMNNLISNALKFTPAGGTIRFGFEVHQKRARFFVKD
ncbi:MAG: sensor histidine kinase, partial [Spirochaetaceae bacterium]